MKFNSNPKIPRRTAADIEACLEQALDPVLSSRRSVTDAARAIGFRDSRSQQFVLHWLKVVCATNAELGFRFASLADQAMDNMDLDGVESWVINALDVYDRQGLYPGVNELECLNSFSEKLIRDRQTVHLSDQQNILERYLRGLSGRDLRIAVANKPHTDTQIAYLPERLANFKNTTDNQLLYKAMATQLWAMSRFGTFRRTHLEAPTLQQRLDEFGRESRISNMFYTLETERLNACIRRELPGLYRAMNDRLDLGKQGDEFWQSAKSALQQTTATVDTTLQWLKRCIEENRMPPEPLLFQGEIDFTRLDEIQAQRLDEDKSALQELIDDLIDKMKRDDADLDPDGDSDLELNMKESEDSQKVEFELTMNGKTIPMPVELRERIDSILQDLDSIPEDWLNQDSQEGDEEPGDGDLDPDQLEEDSKDPVFYYDEWDFQRKHYRKNWCTLFERSTGTREPGFIDQTLNKYSGAVSDLRRTFELLRGEHQVLRRQPFGEDIDIDAMVEANIDRMQGKEVSDRLFLKTHRNVRDIAVMFMVDLSGSTKGWINEAERESLVLLCEALEILGDRYGIYGFSGMTRKRCEIFRIKTMDEPYDDTVKSRIAAIHPRDYTRMGVTIRHLTHLMEKTEARTRLLITLSDGKPDDYDGYRGEYGIEDTRQALIEARNLGIHPFCITIDKQAGEYLPHMYGAVNYTVVDDVRKLPREVSEVYCRLTR
ncbi:MAG: nitric oxide reductase NorD protein [Gammaproteobacteria bacterium]|jgi:nitric oxide reductase NorD protein